MNIMINILMCRMMNKLMSIMMNKLMSIMMNILMSIMMRAREREREREREIINLHQLTLFIIRIYVILLSDKDETLHRTQFV